MNTERHLILCNRALPLDLAEGELPKRIHIVPRGELFNKEAGITQVFDEKSIVSILDDLVKNHAANGGLYMGEEHFIYDSTKSSEAFAWGKEFGADAKGIWTINPDYTDVGAPAIKNKRFKWTSLVADPAKPGAVENLGNGRVRILKIDTVGFTNFPNGKSLLTSITNRAGAHAPADSNNHKHTGPKMKSVCTLLGLSAEADESSVHAAVTKLLNRADVTPAELTTLRNRGDITPDALKSLREENTKLLDEQVDALLAGHGVKEEKVINRLKPVLAGLKNREDRVATLVDFGFKPLEATKPGAQTRVLNRGAGKPTETATEATTAVTPQQLNAEIRKLMNRDGIKDYTIGFNALRAEKPELFATPAQD